VQNPGGVNSSDALTRSAELKESEVQEIQSSNRLKTTIKGNLAIIPDIETLGEHLRP
jgi:hypothetical protein